MQAEKKKLAIIGGLAVVILGIGVFQFTGGSSSPAPAPAAKKSTHGHPAGDAATATGEKTPGAVNETTAGAANNTNGKPLVDGKSTKVAETEMNLAERDPFDGTKYMPKDDRNQGAPTPPAPSKASKRMSVPPIMPTMTGQLPPAGSQVPLQLPNASPQPAQQKPVDTFNYSVSGVVTGDRPAVVFNDAQGNQRLIQVGASLDGDTKVVAVSRGKVTVRRHGKTMTMTVGADPTEKRSDEK